jgi:hypothetical protein
MSTTFGPPIILAGPLPQPLPYGLLAAATMVGEPDERWGNGANVRPYSPELPEVWDPCSTGTFRTKDTPEQPDMPLFSAFGVVLTDVCSGRGVGTDDALDGRARAAFAAVEQWAVEREFARGDLMPSNPYLTDGNADILASGAAVSLAEALALLEKAIGDTGRAGMIHADRGIVAAWSTVGAVRIAGDRLLTYNGTPVASGGGYNGMAPDGEAAPGDEEGWAFATGPVEVRRSPDIEILPGSLREALDRETNVVTYRAERMYLVDWDTQLQAAVLADRSL